MVEEDEEGDALVVEERPLREIISASSKLSPVKKDLTFDKNEMHLLKLINSGNSNDKGAGSSWMNNGVVTTGQVSNKSMTLSGAISKQGGCGQMKEIPGDTDDQQPPTGRKMIKMGEKPAQYGAAYANTTANNNALTVKTSRAD